MNARTLRLLIKKDLTLVRGAFAIYTALGIIAVGLVVSTGDSLVRSLAGTLAVNVLIGTAFHVMLGPVLGEREQRTLAFVLALPVSPRAVGLAKVLTAYVLFLVPGTMASMALARIAPAALVGYYPAVLGAWIVLFTIVLATAVVSESMGWTIGMLLLLLFIVGNGLMQVAPRLEWLQRLVGRGLAGGWMVPGTLVAEALCVGATLGVMLAFQRRKTSFV